MSTKLAYRPDIDGLRAVAVLGVLLYHYGATWLPGGFTGVDVFFVISGYLITKILRREFDAGEFSILGFYERRIRRIVPALFVVLAATLIAGWFTLMPGDYADLGASAAWAAAGLGNLYFYANTGYFDRAAEMQPLLHTWSLGVEEQFYLVWPAALLIGLTTIKSRRIFVALLTLGVAVAFAYAVQNVWHDPKGAFYLPHARAWELAIGALLAFMPAVGAKWLSRAMAAVGAALILWSFLRLSADDPFPGLNATYACIGATLLIWPKEANFVSRVLALQPVVWIGLISYSLYLWHWPVLVFFRHYNNGEMPGLPAALVLAMGSVALAYVSRRYVEDYFLKRFKAPSMAPGVAAILVIAVAGAALAQFSGVPGRVPSTVQGMRSLDAMWEWQCPQTVEAFNASYCAFGDDWENADSRTVLWGDSHAEHFAPVLEQNVPKGTSVLLLRGCLPIVDNSLIVRSVSDAPLYSRDCGLANEQVISSLRHESIGRVIVAAAWAAYQNELHPDGQPVPGDVDQKTKLLRSGLSNLVARLKAEGVDVSLLADVPQRPSDPVPCAAGLYSGLWRAKCQPEQMATPAPAFRSTHAVAYTAIRETAESTGVSAVYPGDALCGPEQCLSELRGEPIYRDGTHLRRNLAPETLHYLGTLIGLGAAFH